ncbi:glycosyltransferase family 39 protein [bacterium]|nr:glycosyltransferase family 39 protein [bacterium]
MICDQNLSQRTTKLMSLVILLFTVWLLLYRIGELPPIWYDEGFFLTTAKTFANEGRYGIHLLDYFRIGHISVGPSVILPIACAFKIFGVDLIVARLVMAVFALLSICLVIKLGERLKHSSVGLIAAALIVTDPLQMIGYSAFARNVLGEVAATTYLLTSILIWHAHGAKVGSKQNVISGIFAGLAVSAKPQMLLAVALLVLVRLLFSWHKFKQVKACLLQQLTFVLGFLLIIGMQTVLLIAPVGINAFLEQMGYLSVAATRLIVHAGGKDAVDLGNVVDSQRRVVFFALLAACIFLFRKLNYRNSLLSWEIAAIAIGWQAWFLFVSIGWWRYGFPGYFFTALIIALALYELITVVSAATRLVLIGSLTCLSLFGMRNLINDFINLPADNSAAQITQYINAKIPVAAKIETYEWDIAFLLDRTTRFPPLDVHYKFLNRSLDGTNQDYAYRFWEKDTDYIVVGPFGFLSFEVYPRQALIDYAEPVYGVGKYGLYKLKKTPKG